MELMDSINRYKNNILNIFIIILALIIASNIYRSQARIIELLRQMKDNETKKNIVLGNIGNLEKKLNSYKNFLTKKDTSLILNTISVMARDTDIKIVSIKPRSEKEYPSYIKYYFDLVISAKDYHHVGKFISKIESSSDIYIVENINTKFLPENQISGSTHRVSIELTLSTVFF